MDARLLLGEGVEPGAVVERLQVALRLTASRPRRVRRLWLDTFDWRLFEAGLSLQRERESKRAWLRLSDLEGRELARAPVSAAELRFAAALPEALAERLSPLLGVRALLPLTETATTVEDVAVLDSLDKTVVRLVFEQPRIGAAPLPWSLLVQAVRGYESWFERVMTQLGAVAGLRQDERPPVATLLRASGLAPGRRAEAAGHGLSREAPAGMSFRTILGRQLATVETNLDGVRRDLDVEFLHDMRVAIRRSRTALKLARGALPPAEVEPLRVELGWLGQITTPVRDLDVQILDLPELVAPLAEGARKDLEPLGCFLARRREEAFGTLAAGLASERFASVLESWRKVANAPVATTGTVAAAPAASGTAATGTGPEASEPGRAAAGGSEAGGSEETAPTGEVSDDRIARCFRKVLRRGRRIGPDSEPAAFHDLRKRCKELRYMLEFFAELYDKEKLSALVRQLKDLQDNLGELHDREVQLHELRELAEAMGAAGVEPGCIFAMGELAATVEESRSVARAGFAERFDHFSSRRNRALAAELLGRPL
jgi:CHAD domain-containing protein